MAGGDARELYTSSSSGRALLVGWSPDGRSLFFLRQTAGPAPSPELWQVAQDGGEPVRIDLQTDMPLGLSVSVHPDGRQVVFSAGEPAYEVWVLENIMAELEAAK